MSLSILSGRAAAEWVRTLVATPPSGPDPAEVREILTRVRAGGDAALLELGERLDGIRPPSLRVDPARIREAAERIGDGRREALEAARRSLERFHAVQRRSEPVVTTGEGVRAWREFRPIRRVGVYVPGGRAAYPSSLLMAVVPARIAGCAEIAVCSPPGPEGRPHAAVLAAAGFLDVEEVYAVGGAQAIAALARGTETVPRVDKIVGPGGAWVNAAKLAAFDEVSIDKPAGPSEVVAWADASAPPEWVASELLAQAEHGPDSLCVGILPTAAAARRVAEAVDARLPGLARGELVRASLDGSALLITRREERALEWIEALAPEHLAILRPDARGLAASVSSAGSIFVGPWTPVAAGDYASGTNHILPTGRRARSDGGLSVDDFGRWVQFQEMGPRGIRAIASVVETLAEWEGLPGHARSVRLRRDGSGPGADRGTERSVGPDPGGDPGPGGAPGPGPDRDIAPAPDRAGAVDPIVRRLVRPHLLGAEPYVTARSKHRGGILLDANENPFGPPASGGGDLHRYPDPRSGGLRAALAARFGVEPDRLWIGNGSDEALDVLLRAVAGPGDTAVVPVPTYGLYAARARVHGVRVTEVPLDDDFDLDLPATQEAARTARVVFLCSPNNPTGNLLSRDRVLALAAEASALVVVDEAYVEFSGAASLAPRAGEPANLVVVRTFSKAWGLAGARVGWAAAHPDLVDVLDLAGLPYPLSAPAARAATAALDRAADVEARRDRIVAERERLRAGLEALGIRVRPSEANFLLFFVDDFLDDAATVQRRLDEEFGVVIRDRSRLPRLAGGLRTSVGTPEENDRLLEALRVVLGRETAVPAGGSPTGGTP